MAKTKVLMSFAVTAKLICTFVLAYADCWFSHAVAHLFVFFRWHQEQSLQYWDGWWVSNISVVGKAGCILTENFRKNLDKHILLTELFLLGP